MTYCLSITNTVETWIEEGGQSYTSYMERKIVTRSILKWCKVYLILD